MKRTTIRPSPNAEPGHKASACHTWAQPSDSNKAKDETCTGKHCEVARHLGKQAPSEADEDCEVISTRHNNVGEARCAHCFLDIVRQSALLAKDIATAKASRWLVNCVANMLIKPITHLQSDITRLRLNNVLHMRTLHDSSKVAKARLELASHNQPVAAMDCRVTVKTHPYCARQ